jgi:hypothetical protein
MQNIPRTFLTFTNIRNPLEIFITQLNLLEIRDNTLLMHALGNNGLTATSTPCNEDLSGCGVQFVGDFYYGGVGYEFGYANLDCLK